MSHLSKKQPSELPATHDLEVMRPLRLAGETKTVFEEMRLLILNETPPWQRLSVVPANRLGVCLLSREMLRRAAEESPIIQSFSDEALAENLKRNLPLRTQEPLRLNVALDTQKSGPAGHNLLGIRFKGGGINGEHVSLVDIVNKLGSISLDYSQKPGFMNLATYPDAEPPAAVVEGLSQMVPPKLRLEPAEVHQTQN